MKLIPEPELLRNDWVFAGVYFAEVILLLAGACTAFSHLSGSAILSGSLVLAVMARAFLVWAWGRRFPSVDGFYLAWSAPALLRDTLLSLQCLHFWATRGFSMHAGRISTGDSSIAFWGVMMLAATVSIRFLGIGWISFHSKPPPEASNATWPTFVLASLTAFVVSWFLITLFRVGPHAMLMSLLLFIPQYGFVVYL
jgi:hypothetical protein